MNKAVLASALGSPSAFGQSQFAFMRGNAFEARVKADGGAELLRLVHERLDAGAEPPTGGAVPDLSAVGPEGRTARTALALREATAAGGWTLLDHPLLALDVAGSPAFLEPDAVVVHPDGSWTVVEIKSFPMLDGSADAAKVGAAARQAAVYVLALEQIATHLTPPPTKAPDAGHGAPPAASAGAGHGTPPTEGPDDGRSTPPPTGTDAGQGITPAGSTETGHRTHPAEGPDNGHGTTPQGSAGTGHGTAPAEGPGDRLSTTPPASTEAGQGTTPTGSTETGHRTHPAEGPDNGHGTTPAGSAEARHGTPPAGGAGGRLDTPPAEGAGAGGDGGPAGGPAQDRASASGAVAVGPGAAVVEGGSPGRSRVRHTVLLVCPKDFSNLPTASAVDVRKQRSVTRRQLDRLTRIEDIAAALPEGTCFAPDLPPADLTAAVESVPATYAPECLSACELAFHCRDRSRAQGAVTSLGRSLRAELGGLTTIADVLSAAQGRTGDPTDPAVAALRRAATLRAEALAGGGASPTGVPIAGPARPEAPEHTTC